MIAYAYQNLEESEKQNPIYKIVPIRRLQNILLSKKFGLVNPSLWDDPYENFLLNQKIMNKGIEKSFKELSSSLYGSCWTFNHNTDYGWKVYLNNDLGVQIKTTPVRLYEYFDFLKKDSSLVSFQIGKVIYDSWETIKERYESRKLHKIEYLFNVTSFIKRSGYKHEREIRILAHYAHKKQKVVEVDFDLNKICDQLMFDPRLSYEDYELEKRKLELLGFTGKILRSKLYDAPKLNLKIE